MSETNITEKANQKPLSQDDLFLLSRGFFIISLLAEAKNAATKFPMKDGLVIHEDYFNRRALSAEEILKWFNVSSLAQHRKMTNDELEQIIRCTGVIGYKTTVLNEQEVNYYFLSV